MMGGTSVTCYEVNVFTDGKWTTNLISYDRKSALARAEALNSEGKKWCVWKRTERSEMIGKG